MAARVKAGKHGHLRADKARSLVADMFQGGSNVNLLHSWKKGGTPGFRSIQRRLGLRDPGASRGGGWLGGWGKAWKPDSLLLRKLPGTWCWGASSHGPRALSAVGMVLTFCHAVQYHVNEDVGASSPCTITETGGSVVRLSRGAQQNGGGVEETWKFGLGTTLVDLRVGLGRVLLSHG